MKIVECIEPFANFAREVKFYHGFLKVGVTNHWFLQCKMLSGNRGGVSYPSWPPLNPRPSEPLQSKTVWGTMNKPE